MRSTERSEPSFSKAPQWRFLAALISPALVAAGLTSSPAAAATPIRGLTAISAGGNHTCALTDAGGVKCWGFNVFGQLGDGTQTNRRTPVDVGGLTSGVTAISAGGAHTCALTDAGGVKCWGMNVGGRLGDGTETNRHTPVDVSGLTSGVTAISAGGYHACALTDAGGVKCWGYNFDGALGDGTTTARLTPVDVSGLTSGVSAISAGSANTCALTDGGGAKCWGYNGFGALGDGTTTARLTPVDVSGLTSGVSAISAAGNHTCALTEAGGVKCWGSNLFGNVGDGSAMTVRRTPVDVSSLASGVGAISTDGFHTCALTEAGGVKCWGNNDSGPVGDGTTTERHTPVDVSGLASRVSAITTGYHHTCALTDDGTAKCWGNNVYGALGDGTTTHRSIPVDVVGPPATHSLTVATSGTGSGTVTSSPAGINCGSDCTHDYDEGTAVALTATAGANSTFTGWSGACTNPTGTCVVTMDRARSATATFALDTPTTHSLTLATSGTGSGTVASSPAGIDCGGDCSQEFTDATRVTLVATAGVGSTFAGWSGACTNPTGACIVTMDRARSVTVTFTLDPPITHTLTAATIGSGSGTVTSSPAGIDCGSDCTHDYDEGTQVTLTATAGANSTFAGWSGACTSATGSCVVTMDRARAGTARFTRDVVGAVTPSFIGAGSVHTCALEEGGDAVCWGSNGFTQAPPRVTGPFTTITAGGLHNCGLDVTGDAVCFGFSSNDQAPPRVTGPFTTISAGGSHTCALKSGDAVCWGFNRSGQAPPEKIGPFTAISAGELFTCALDESGGPVCWGFNGEGQASPPSTTGLLAITSGGNHACALKNGDAVCWGYNAFGQAPPAGVAGPFTAIDAGQHHTCALDESGDAVCWGWNANGQAPPAGRAGSFTDIAAGQHHTCALEESRDVVCWGYNGDGQAPVRKAGPFGPPQGARDSDGDGVPDADDAFPNNPAEHTDTDGDGIGDNSDEFPNEPDEDADGDGVPDRDDAFPNNPNEDTDTDGDRTGDNSDSDDDNDGTRDASDAFPKDHTEDTDTDGDGTGDNSDAFPNDPDEDTDTDGDAIGDASDFDDDQDWVPDASDAFPKDEADYIDTDGDGTGDNSDAFPNDAAEVADTDGDGTGDNSDSVNEVSGQTVRVHSCPDSITIVGDHNRILVTGRCFKTVEIVGTRNTIVSESDAKIVVRGKSNKLTMRESAVPAGPKASPTVSMAGDDNRIASMLPGVRIAVAGSDNSTVTSSGADEVAVVSGSGNTVRTGAGNDLVVIGGVPGAVSETFGELIAHTEELVGGSRTPEGNRVLTGSAVDRVFGGNGSDVLESGAGGDQLRGRGGDDVLKGSGGDDFLSGGPGADTLSGGTGEDRCSGGPGKNKLTSCER